ncbi:MAG: hypothetical protein PF518_07125 [Spirochaetaceae bacterium]|nr:hypothetical protein [Spirochaetaceae bacterium]
MTISYTTLAKKEKIIDRDERSSAMVVDIRDIILAKGIDFSKVISEIYF